MSRAVRTERTVDKLSGEVLSERSNVIELKKIEDEPDYIKLYIKDLAHYFSLQPLEARVLTAVASMMDYTGVAVLTASRRLSIRTSLGCSRQGFDNALTALQRAKLLARVGRGEYQPNPNLFGRGRWIEIRERRASFLVNVKYNAAPAAPIRDIKLAVDDG